MRSRSYYAIAGSSLSLLIFSCLVSKADDRKADAKADAKADDRKEDAKEDVPGTDTGEELHGFPEAGDDDGGDEAGASETGAPMPKSGAGTSLKGADGCRKGQMPFDGICLSKDRVSEILDQRGAEALAKVKNANQPQQTAEAAYDLIEQQTYQVDKVEDDLDEIIEQLKQENAERDEKDKDGKGAP